MTATLVGDLVLIGAAGAAFAAMGPPEDITWVTQFIRDVGFPIFVAAYVLIRLERTMGKMSEAINQLTKKLSE